MKNQFSQDLNLLKIIKSLSKGKCAGCIFNKIGTCALLDVHKVDSDVISDQDVMSDKFNCKYKILHQDLADFLVGEFLYIFNSEKPVCLTELNLLVKKINNFKEIETNENL